MLPRYQIAQVDAQRLLVELDEHFFESLSIFLHPLMGCPVFGAHGVMQKFRFCSREACSFPFLSLGGVFGFDGGRSSMGCG